MSNECETLRQFTITWKIENYCLCPKNEIFESPEITAESLGGSKWYLILHPHGNRNEGYISCHLYRCGNDNGEEKIFIDFEIEIISAEGETLKSHKVKNVAFLKGNGFGWNEFMEGDQLVKKMKKCTQGPLIIRCHMKNKQRIKPATDCEVRTINEFERRFLKWNVEFPNSSDWSVGLRFSVLHKVKIEITLIAPEDDILINICLESGHSFFVKGRISLLDVNGAEQNSKNDGLYYNPENGEEFWEFPNFISKSHLKNEADTFLKNDIFTLSCEFEVCCGIQSQEVEKYTRDAPLSSSAEVDTFSVLHKDLLDMFTSRKHCDVKLRADNQELPAHKSVLAARSPVFSAMFDQDMLENKTGVVDVPDLDAKTLESFLIFMYTGTVDDMDYESSLKLLVMGDKYQVLSLKEKCSVFLMFTLSDVNVYEVLTIADMVGQEPLKKLAVDFIIMNAARILPSPEWSQWVKTNATLATEIFSKLAAHFGDAASKMPELSPAPPHLRTKKNCMEANKISRKSVQNETVQPVKIEVENDQLENVQPEKSQPENVHEDKKKPQTVQLKKEQPRPQIYQSLPPECKQS